MSLAKITLLMSLGMTRGTGREVTGSTSHHCRHERASRENGIPSVICVGKPHVAPEVLLVSIHHSSRQLQHMPQCASPAHSWTLRPH